MFIRKSRTNIRNSISLKNFHPCNKIQVEEEIPTKDSALQLVEEEYFVQKQDTKDREINNTSRKKVQ